MYIYIPQFNYPNIGNHLVYLSNASNPKVSKMRFVLSASIFGVITFVSVTEAQINHTDASRNVRAPHLNVWKALSEQEAANISSLLSERLRLTGDQGSRQGLPNLVPTPQLMVVVAIAMCELKRSVIPPHSLIYTVSN